MIQFFVHGILFHYLLFILPSVLSDSKTRDYGIVILPVVLLG